MSPLGANAGAMIQAAENLLAVLPGEQRAELCFGFDDPHRRDWRYTPGRRRGVSLAEMEREAAKAVHQLLTTVVSRATHTQVAAITGLEDVLDESEGGLRGRHAGDYWTAVFGDPGAPAWGWRFEGHHVSINVTVAAGAISATPLFLGANPATVTDEVGCTVSRPLAPEEEVGLILFMSLDDDQRTRAVASDAAPPDILSGEEPDARTVIGLGGFTGLPATALRADQVSLLRSLVGVYVNRLSSHLAKPIMAEVDHDLSAFSFAWAGSTLLIPGQPQYYRIEGPRFLVEFDNRQGGANHIHTVWREPGGDFGARLLAEGLSDLS
jgi:Protein of unknown function (DUF3500)